MHIHVVLVRRIMTHSSAIMSPSVQGDYDVKEKYS